MNLIYNIQKLRYFGDIQTVFRTLSLWCVFVLLQTPAISHAAIADPIKKMYLWNAKGCTLYASPFYEADSVGFLHYGESVEIVEIFEGAPIEVTIYTQQESSQHLEEYLKDDQLSSKWVKIQYNNQSGYILDTYLSSILPPDLSHDMGFKVENYLKSLSPIILEKKEDQTDEFCERDTLHFENGIHYTYTDFGPCQQCGHSQQKMYFPVTNKKEGIIMALHFFRLSGLFSEGNEVILKKTKDSLEIEVNFDYGPLKLMHIVEQEHGVLLIEDSYL